VLEIHFWLTNKTQHFYTRKLVRFRGHMVRVQTRMLSLGTTRNSSCMKFKMFIITPLVSEFFPWYWHQLWIRCKKFQTNYDTHDILVHNIYIQPACAKHQPQDQKGVYYTGIHLFSILRPVMKRLNHKTKVLKQQLEYLLSYSSQSAPDLISNENLKVS
jgi:hypothetical protein